MRVRQPSYPKISQAFGLMAGLCLGLAGPVSAETKTWISTAPANITTDTAWSSTGAPTASDVITTNLSTGPAPGNLQITADTTIAGIVQNLATGNWIINESAGGTIAFTVTGTILKSNTDTLTIRRSSPNLLKMVVGELDVSGGTMDFGDKHGTSLFQMTAATTNVSGGALTLDVANDYNLGNVNVSGGILTLNTDNQDVGATHAQTVTVTSLVGTGGTIQGSSDITTTGMDNVTLLINQAANTTTSTVLTNGNASVSKLSVTKAGTGTLTLTANNTYTGTTVVAAGTLLINGNNSTSAVTSGSGATLGGSGTTGAITVQSGGAVAPGNASAVLTSSAATFSGSASVLGIGIASTGGSGAVSLDGSHYDQMVLTGTSASAETVLALTDSTLKLTLSGSPVALDKYFVVVLQDALDSSTGAFAWATDGISTVAISGGTFTLDGQSYAIGYNGDSTTNSLTGGNDVVIQAVPEPATTLLLGVGAGLVVLRWRGRKRHGV